MLYFTFKAFDFSKIYHFIFIFRNRFREGIRSFS